MPRKAKKQAVAKTCVEPCHDISQFRQKVVKCANLKLELEMQQLAKGGWRQFESSLQRGKKIKFNQDSNRTHLYQRWIDPVEESEEGSYQDEQFLPNE